MKNFGKSLLGILFLLSTSNAVADAPSLVGTTVNKIYIPYGFDDNDNVQLVGEGIFPDSCYKPGLSTASVDLEKREITLEPTVYKYHGYCLMVLLPFEISFQFGPLKAGAYSIKRSDGTPLGSLYIRRSTPSEPDDYLYAPISQAFLSRSSSSSAVLLTGQFPLSCMRIKDVRFQIQNEAIVVQPIVELDSNSPCNPGSFPFSTKTELGVVKKGRYLLHVRSMNGKSVNSLVDVE